MRRPGFTVTLEKDSPPMMFNSGDGFHYEKLPEGTRVIYPPEPLEPLPDPNVAIERALLSPMEMEPLHELLFPGMKLTIAFDDLSLPLPPMQRPDVRQLVIEKVLEKAYARGVEDIHIIAALGLHRRMTEAELRHCLGKRIMSRYYPDRLYNYDAEDPEGNVKLGETERGEDVTVSRRVAESDLLVYVNINYIPMDGGHKSVHTGLAPYSSIRHHHTPDTLSNTRSLMDPKNSALHGSVNRMGAIFDEHVKVFHIETTLNNAAFPAIFDFMAKPEHEWSAVTKANFLANHKATQRMPRSLARRVFHTIKAPHRMTSVQAGATDPVHAETLRNNYEQQVVPVEGQSDVLLLGIPYLGPYNVNSIMNPLLVYNMFLGYLFNLYRGRPLVREGGVLIGTHPMSADFHKVHHPSYIDLWNEALSETNDIREIHRRYEEKYANDPWYRTLYRNSYAYHGVHPFTVLYWAAHALDHLSDAILVGGDPGNCARMGLRHAVSVAEALEMARDVVGPSPSVTYMHVPPLFMCEVS
ncbi:MAG: lactate racemase domain-containing protein [Actinomycetota bacterium]